MNFLIKDVLKVLNFLVLSPFDIVKVRDFMVGTYHRNT